jgi:hypothetical protein
MSEEEDGNTGSSGEEEQEIRYTCKHCPGLDFSEAEMEAHRQMHREQRTR